MTPICSVGRAVCIVTTGFEGVILPQAPRQLFVQLCLHTFRAYPVYTAPRVHVESCHKLLVFFEQSKALAVKSSCWKILVSRPTCITLTIFFSICVASILRRSSTPSNLDLHLTSSVSCLPAPIASMCRIIHSFKTHSCTIPEYFTSLVMLVPLVAR